MPAIWLVLEAFGALGACPVDTSDTLPRDLAVHRGPFRAHRAIRFLDTFVPSVVDIRSFISGDETLTVQRQSVRIIRRMNAIRSRTADAEPVTNPSQNTTAPSNPFLQRRLHQSSWHWSVLLDSSRRRPCRSDSLDCRRNSRAPVAGLVHHGRLSTPARNGNRVLASRTRLCGSSLSVVHVTRRPSGEQALVRHHGYSAPPPISLPSYVVHRGQTLSSRAQRLSTGMRTPQSRHRSPTGQTHLQQRPRICAPLTRSSDHSPGYRKRTNST